MQKANWLRVSTLDDEKVLTPEEGIDLLDQVGQLLAEASVAFDHCGIAVFLQPPEGQRVPYTIHLVATKSDSPRLEALGKAMDSRGKRQGGKRSN